MAFQDFDQISQRRQQERQQRKKKIITVVVALFILLLFGAGAGVGVFFYKRHENNKEKERQATPSSSRGVFATEKAVKTVCAGTDYREVCEESLKKTMQGNDAAQPKDILKTSITVVLQQVNKIVEQASKFKLDTPQTKAAMDDCMTLFHDAMEELNSSISTVEGNELSKLSGRTPDLNNWLSAVLSYQQTCIDGFPDGEDKATIERMGKSIKELGSNSLAIVSQVSSVLSRLQVPDIKRTLVAAESGTSDVDEDGLPAWLSEKDRRMLRDEPTKPTPNVIVAKDGSGNYATINEALNAMPKEYEGRYVIYVKEGIYDETVIVTKKMVNVTMYGDGSQKSVITGSKNFVDGVPTFQTATFAALGEGFMAQSIGFRNTAGPEKHQAVALRVQADRSIFLNCRMEAYQDTLYAQTHRQFYRSCYITGTVDFIFGDAASIFQNCMIYARRPMDNQQNIVTAQGRVDKRETTGFVLHNCRILADETLKPDLAMIKSYLGRPWKEYSRTIVMETDIGDLIQPEGWLEWSGDFALKTLYYGEYNNKGPRADTSSRVKWPGYRVIRREEALRYTIAPFLDGDSWLKLPNVPVRFGLFR